MKTNFKNHFIAFFIHSQFYFFYLEIFRAQIAISCQPLRQEDQRLAEGPRDALLAVEGLPNVLLLKAKSRLIRKACNVNDLECHSCHRKFWLFKTSYTAAQSACW